MTPNVADDGLVARLRTGLGGVTSPVMRGDNLAILLCGEFDDDGEQDYETVWSRAAVKGCDEVLDAIHAYYAEALTRQQQDHAAEVEKLRRERDEARLLVIEANNSLYGSRGYFHSLSGGPYDKYHLANGIENLKKQTREDYAARLAAEAALASARAECPWQPIATRPDSNDLMWFWRGDTFEGPRQPSYDDVDYWDYWCLALPPSWPAELDAPAIRAASPAPSGGE